MSWIDGAEATATYNRIHGIETVEAGVEMKIPTYSGSRIAFAATDLVPDYDPYDYAKWSTNYNKQEPVLYKEYRRMWLDNPYTYLLVEYLLNEVFGNDYHFSGPGAEEVEEFFENDNTKTKLKIAFRQAILIGNGFIDMNSPGGKLDRTSVIDGESVRIHLDGGKRKYSQIATFFLSDRKQANRKLRAKNLVHFMVKQYPSNPYGISLLRPNMRLLHALNDIASDIPAVVKRAGYAPIVAALNLEGLPDDAEKESVVKDFANKLQKNYSATSNYTIDQKHELSLLGQGAAGARMLPVREFVEILLAVCLLNFGMPLGNFLQSASNRSILMEQREIIGRFIEELRSIFSWHVNNEIVPKITDKRAKIRFHRAQESWLLEGSAMMNMYQLGLVSKEYVLDRMNIEDDGSTFFELPEKVQVGEIKKRERQPD